MFWCSSGLARVGVVWAIVGLLSFGGSADAQFYPKQKGVTSESTGYIEAKVPSGWFSGSAVIARDPRLIYSCAHVFFDQGRWATTYKFHRAYNSFSSPRRNSGATPRGLRYFTGYADAAVRRDGSTAAAFSLDFVVLYGPGSFGPAVGWWQDGGAAMQSSNQKRIVGYPSRIDYTGAPGRSYQHTTDYFTISGRRVRDAYFSLNNVSTGGGNSGGPVFVSDKGTDALAAILVSGGFNSAGVRVLDQGAHTMALNALQSAGGGGGGGGLRREKFQNRSTLRLPDGTQEYSSRSVNVAGFNGVVRKLHFGLTIRTSYRGDLDVYLRSPSGRIQWVSRQQGGSQKDLRIRRANYSRQFRGRAANGEWTVFMRDALSGDRARFQNFALTVAAD